jgi:hypothetical protein
MGVKRFLKQRIQNARQRATVWAIIGRRRRKAIGFVGLHDFDLQKAGEMALPEIAGNRQISLYALNHHQREAIFVETPPDVDLTLDPFLYQAQYKKAIRVITMPYALFHQFAALLTHSEPQMIFIHSVGRCGSTLLSNVFNKVSGTMSLSEPDAFTAIVRERRLDGKNDPEMVQLLRAVLRVQSRPFTTGEPARVVVKFRSFSTVITDLLHHAAPQAKHIFLYRNAISRARSAARAFESVAADYEPMSAAQVKMRGLFVPLLRRPEYAQRALAGELSSTELYMLAWLSGMETILDLQAAEVPLLPVRYEEMVEAPTAVVDQIFAYCGIPPERVAAGAAAFDRDSQQGSSLARAKLGRKKGALTETDIAQINQLLAEHPRINDADFRIPNTLSVPDAA